MSHNDDLLPQVEKNLPWNFTVNLLDVAFYMLALNLVARQTILPVLVSQLTPSKMALGLIPAIDSLGYLLPQLLMANYTERLRRKLPFVATIGISERLPYLLIALIIWRFAASDPAATVIALFLLLIVHTVSGGIVTPGWFDLIAKVIPARRRGLWSGLAHGLGALLGVAGAALAGEVLATQPYPENFAICFLLAFAALVASWVALILNREPDSPLVKASTPFTTYVRQLPRILRQDTNYTRFLLARSVGILGGMAIGFYAVYGSERWQLGGEGIAILTAMLTGSQAIMNVFWGLIGDRYGHKLVLAAGMAVTCLASVVAAIALAPTWLWVTFALVGTANAAATVSNLNIVLEFCMPEDRPTYIGLTNTLLAPVAIVAPLIGGALATAGGYCFSFAVAALCAGLGTLMMALWVREPRAQASGH